MHHLTVDEATEKLARLRTIEAHLVRRLYRERDYTPKSKPRLEHELAVTRRSIAELNGYLKAAGAAAQPAYANS